MVLRGFVGSALALITGAVLWWLWSGWDMAFLGLTGQQWAWLAGVGVVGMIAATAVAPAGPVGGLGLGFLGSLTLTLSWWLSGAGPLDEGLRLGLGLLILFGVTIALGLVGILVASIRRSHQIGII